MEFCPGWHEIWPHAEGTHMVTGNHFLQEDSGAEIDDLLVEGNLGLSKRSGQPARSFA